MCGRITQHTDPKALAKAFEAAFADAGTAEALAGQGPRYNIPPGTPIAVVRNDVDGARDARPVVARARWGLVPPWKSGGGGHANARAEGLAERPTFSAAFAARRCLVPADGFYEWDRRYKPRKPYYFESAEGKVLAMAGIWEWGVAADGDRVMTVAVVTREAAGPVARIHDRMPLFIPESLSDEWLRSDSQRPLASFLRAGLAVEVTQTAVSLAVNDARMEGPDLVKAVEGPTGTRYQADLFGG